MGRLVDGFARSLDLKGHFDLIVDVGELAPRQSRQENGGLVKVGGSQKGIFVGYDIKIEYGGWKKSESPVDRW
jgi:hypothetical protein